MDLNEDQRRALGEIDAVRAPGNQHLLTGHAGSGKTTLVQAYAQQQINMGRRVVLSAPTHKAVAVLARKMPKTEGLSFATIHALLGLVPRTDQERLIFERKGVPGDITAPIIIVDECSMLGAELMQHIHVGLANSFVLFVGDPAQLPPVNEAASKSFLIESHSHLSRIVRQAEGNPILEAATEIREQQGHRVSWRWCHARRAPPLGVYVPKDAEKWMKHGFLSDEFKADPDSFRYVCWTNQRVAKTNLMVREWIYGEVPALPFVPGERALARAPAYIEIEDVTSRGKVKTTQQQIIATNEEVTVRTIKENFLDFTPSALEFEPWTVRIPVWTMVVEKDNGQRVIVHLKREPTQMLRDAFKLLKEEASIAKSRWKDFHRLQQKITPFQHVYAMTVHVSQGSTFKNCFVDIGDIRRRTRSNPLETQQLCYVAATRPSHALVLVGA